MKQAVIIRSAKKKDLSNIIDLATSLEDTEKPFDLNIKEGYYKTKQGKRSLIKNIKDKKRIFLVAEIDKEVIGFIDGYLYENDDAYIQNFAYLDRVSVSSNHQNKGIATSLIQEFSKIVSKKGAKILKLNAFEQNNPAITLYKKLGFQEYSIFYTKEIEEEFLV